MHTQLKERRKSTVSDQNSQLNGPHVIYKTYQTNL